MAAVIWDIHTASEELLAELCERAAKEDKYLLGGHPGVVKLSDDVAVKFGYGVLASEAKTQEFAHRNADPSIVHVPRVYRFFQRNDPERHVPKGYLFMEYVPGPTLKELVLQVHTDIIPRVAKIIAHLGKFRTVKCQAP
jgi:serine/threonine protein kinase